MKVKVKPVVKPTVMNGGIKVIFKKSINLKLKKKYTYRQTSKSNQDLADDLMYVGKFGSYSPTLNSRLRKAIRYMEEHETNAWKPLSPRKKAMILSTIRACNRDRMIKYNASPESEHYWSS